MKKPFIMISIAGVSLVVTLSVLLVSTKDINSSSNNKYAKYLLESELIEKVESSTTEMAAEVTLSTDISVTETEEIIEATTAVDMTVATVSEVVEETNYVENGTQSHREDPEYTEDAEQERIDDIMFHILNSYATDIAAPYPQSYELTEYGSIMVIRDGVEDTNHTFKLDKDLNIIND